MTIESKAAYKALSYAITARRENTEEWLDGLVNEVNEFLLTIGSRDRVARHGDGLRIVRNKKDDGV